MDQKQENRLEVREITRKHLLSIKAEYFEQDRWYEALCRLGLEKLTFASAFVPVRKDEADALLQAHVEPCYMHPALDTLTEKISGAKAQLSADRIFVKFVRSPKDASVVYKKAAQVLPDLLRAKPHCGVWQLFGEARQEGLGVGTAVEAVSLLSSSGRVCAAQGAESSPEGGDLWWAVNGGCFGAEFSFEQMNPTLMVRSFSGALPLQVEWRAFVWDGKCSAVSQYFYDFGFPELQSEEVHQHLASDLLACLETVSPLWDHLATRNAMIDFAWTPLASQPVTLIEVNPSHPEKGLGHTSSLALFNWDVEADRAQLTGQGPAQIEIRVADVLHDTALERKVHRSWSTVGYNARQALKAALKSLSSEELEASHVVTRAIARKLGVHNSHMQQDKGKDKRVAVRPICPDVHHAKGKGKKGAKN